MEKRILALLCALLLLTLVGCGSTEPAETTAPIETTVHVHDYAMEVVEPDCTKGGYTGYYCACGDSYTEDETEALGHSYSEQVVAPTWEEEGYTLTYEETSLTGLEGTTTTFLVRPDNITLIRVGTINNEMIFKVGQRHVSLYQTPYGGLMFEVNTKKAEADLSEKGGHISIRYMMEMEHETVSENSFGIQVSNPDLPQ